MGVLDLVSDLLDGYRRHLESWASPETVRPRLIVLRAVAAALPYGLDYASAEDLEAWLARWSGWTRCTYWHNLNAFYTWAVWRGHLSWSPMDMLVRPRPPKGEPRPASEEQVAIALARLRPGMRRAVMLAAFAGLRCAEVARARREDVTRERIRVVRKGGKVQQLPVHEVIWADVDGLPPGPLVTRPRGGGYPPAKLSAAVSQALTAVGLAQLTLHWFRHRYATILLLPKDLGGAGADIRTVQELMGHESLASTQIYTQVSSAQRRSAIARLPVPALR